MHTDPPRYDLVVVGDANPDLILRGDVVPRFGQSEQLLSSADLVLGASAAITAHAAARLGLRTALVSVVGADAFGDFVIQQLERAQVDVSYIARSASPTGISVVLSTTETRTTLTYLGAIPTLGRADLDVNVIGQTRHVHASSFFLQPELAAALPELFARAHEAGATTSLDTNADPAGLWSGVAEVLPYVDVLLPNRAEAIALAAQLTSATPASLEAAARALASHGPIVVVKDGADGALGVRGGECIRVPAPTVEVVDTTGAGDTFNAAFIQAWISQLPLEECLRIAAAVGAQSTTWAGGPGPLDDDRS